MTQFKDKKTQREYEENIKDDVMDFMKEIAGIKKPEFPVGITKEWRKDKEDVKKRKYEDDKDKK